MTISTRCWNGIAAALLLALCGCASEKLPFDAGLAKLVPADTVLIAGAHVAEAAKSELFESMLTAVDEPLRRLSAETGLDPRRDITEALIASPGESAALAIALGKFDVAALEAKLKANGFEPSGKLWRKGANAITFPDSSIALAGPPALIEAALERKGMPEPLRALLREIPRDAHLWAASNGGIPAFRAPERSNWQNIEKAMGSVRSMTMHASFKNGVTARVTGHCPNEQEANKLHGGLRGLMGIARLSTPSGNAGLLSLWDGLKVDLVKSDVVASVQLTAAQVKDLRSMLGSGARR